MPDLARTTTALLSLSAVLLLCPGCGEKKDTGRRDPGVAYLPSPYSSSVAYRGTVGELTYFQGVNAMAVRGYGLVVGLGDKGSTSCPRTIHDKLIQSVYKHHDFNNPAVGRNDVTPEQMLKDPDTAVVLVEGEIPPGAVAGAAFDLFVRAIPGTDTTSLRGGRLYTTDLNVYRAVGPTSTIEGKILAQGRGPLFHNPFSDDKSATRDDPLEAIILGGGEVVESRRIRLVLAEPSYPRARQIMDRINDQFPGGDEKTADALTPSFVQITVPAKFHDDYDHFLSLLRCLYLTRDANFAAQRSRELAAELLRPDAPHALISLCFEGLGRICIPDIEQLYADTRGWVSFHAAVAGVRLGDHIAVDALALHANSATSDYRYQAIRALGRADDLPGAGQELRRLLNDEDPRVRVAAYEELARREDYQLRSKTVADDNFHLDIVPSTASPLVYAKRAGTRRIALFGDGLRLDQPVFYRAPEGTLTIDWPEGAPQPTLLRVTPRGAVSEPIPGPGELPELVEFLGRDVELDGDKVLGLGLDYGSVVRALYYLTKDKALDAPFVLEQPNAAELFGPLKKLGRKESDL